MAALRTAFHDRLDQLTSRLVTMGESARRLLEDATQGLLDPDLAAAERAIAADREIDAMQHAVEDDVVLLLALEAPVASDLRRVTASLRIAADLERMADLAVHVAEVARRRYPSPAVPAELHAIVERMGEVASALVDKATVVIAEGDVERARELDQDDDQMDDLQTRLHEALLDGTWTGGMECAVDLALLARYYERYADHAVSVGRRVAYLMTGQWEAA